MLGSLQILKWSRNCKDLYMLCYEKYIFNSVSIETATYLVLIIDKDFSAFVSQESVRPSISARNCSHASRLAGPRSPATPKSKAVSREEHVSGPSSLVSLLCSTDNFYSSLYHKWRETWKYMNFDPSFHN